MKLKGPDPKPLPREIPFSVPVTEDEFDPMPADMRRRFEEGILPPMQDETLALLYRISQKVWYMNLTFHGNGYLSAQVMEHEATASFHVWNREGDMKALLRQVAEEVKA